MSLYETQLVKDANEAMDHYRTEYQKKYGVQPLLPGASFNAGMTTLNDLIRKVGVDRVKKMITTYLKHEGENGWYKKMGHSIPCFGKNVDQLNVLTKDQPLQPKGRGLKMLVRTRCINEKCKKHHLIEVYGDEMDRVYNELCEQCKNLPMREVEVLGSKEKCYF